MRLYEINEQRKELEKEREEIYNKQHADREEIKKEYYKRADKLNKSSSIYKKIYDAVELQLAKAEINKTTVDIDGVIEKYMKENKING